MAFSKSVSFLNKNCEKDVDRFVEKPLSHSKGKIILKTAYFKGNKKS